MAYDSIHKLLMALSQYGLKMIFWFRLSVNSLRRNLQYKRFIKWNKPSAGTGVWNLYLSWNI